MKRRVGALLMALVLVMTGFAAYAEEETSTELAVEDSVEDVAVSEEPAETGENMEAISEEEIPAPEGEETEAEEGSFDVELEEEILDAGVPTQTYRGSSGDLSVTVEAPEGALPDEAQLYVQCFDAGSKEYNEVYSYLQKKVREEDFYLEVADIYFTANGEKIDPNTTVTVKLDVSTPMDRDAYANIYSLQAWNYTDKTEGTANADAEVVEFETTQLQTFAATWEDGDETTADYGISYLADDTNLEDDDEGKGNSGASLSVEVSHRSENAEEPYRAGTEVIFDIVVTNDGEVPLTDIEVTNNLTESQTIQFLDVDEPSNSETLEVFYSITEKDAEAGSVEIDVTATGQYLDYTNLDDPKSGTIENSNSDIIYTNGTLKDDLDLYGIITLNQTESEESDLELDPELSINITVTSEPEHDNYRQYETVTLSISLTNTGNVNLGEIEVDFGEEDDYPLYVESLIQKENYPYSLTKYYEVTEEDVERGYIVFSVTAKGKCVTDTAESGDDSEDSELIDIPVELSGDLKIPTEIGPQLTLEIKINENHEPENGNAYKEDETIKYHVIVKNTGDVTVSDIQVDCPWADDSSEQFWVIEDPLGQGESYKKTITYTVKDYDTIKDSYNDDRELPLTLTAFAIGTSKPEDESKVLETVDADCEETVFVEPRPQKFVSLDNKGYNDEGKEVNVDDTLYYLITYKNTDTETKDVKITDILDDGLEFVSAENGGTLYGNTVTWTIENVQPQGSGSVKLTTKVTGKAKDWGGVWNSATVQLGDDAKTTFDVYNLLADDEPVKPTKSVSAGSERVSVGQELKYTIRYYNHHNEVETVTITDDLEDGLTYVDKSASDGGSYKSGTITWEVEADPFSWGEVSFKATVNSNAVTTTTVSDEYYDDEEDEEDEEGEGNTRTSSSYSESVTTGKVENYATVQIGDDAKIDTDPVTNEIYSTSSSGGGSGSGSVGDGSEENTAVKTADDTPAATMLFLFGAAFVALGADMIYRRRRTQR